MAPQDDEYIEAKVTIIGAGSPGLSIISSFDNYLTNIFDCTYYENYVKREHKQILQESPDNSNPNPAENIGLELCTQPCHRNFIATHYGADTEEFWPRTIEDKSLLKKMLATINDKRIWDLYFRERFIFFGGGGGQRYQITEENVFAPGTNFSDTFNEKLSKISPQWAAARFFITIGVAHGGTYSGMCNILPWLIANGTEERRLEDIRFFEELSTSDYRSFNTMAIYGLNSHIISGRNMETFQNLGINIINSLGLMMKNTAPGFIGTLLFDNLKLEKLVKPFPANQQDESRLKHRNTLLTDLMLTLSVLLSSHVQTADIQTLFTGEAPRQSPALMVPFIGTLPINKNIKLTEDLLRELIDSTFEYGSLIDCDLEATVQRYERLENTSVFLLQPKFSIGVSDEVLTRLVDEIMIGKGLKTDVGTYRTIHGLSYRDSGPGGQSRTKRKSKLQFNFKNFTMLSKKEPDLERTILLILVRNPVIPMLEQPFQIFDNFYEKNIKDKINKSFHRDYKEKRLHMLDTGKDLNAAIPEFFTRGTDWMRFVMANSKKMRINDVRYLDWEILREPLLRYITGR
ncbi:MAG: hypothetical protein GF308_00160 [Candidatus Heimdallarchaeota archaeon]|nr:hypothetical protein [Candidatus Heimdallarchaeota archaeon]